MHTIRWNEYTWYSKLAATIFFVAILPSWTFYLGIQYDMTRSALNPISSSENIQKSDNTVSEVFPWEGQYTFSESAPPDENWIYKLAIVRTNGKWQVKVDIDGFQTETRILATANAVDNSLDVIFDSYGPDNLLPTFKKGDRLFSVTPSSDGLLVTWDMLQPNLSSVKDTAVFTK